MPKIPQPAPAVRLILTIDEVPYALDVLPRRDGDEALRSWQLAKLGGKGDIYYVTEEHSGAGGFHCGCADFHYRHEGLPTQGCKHIRALRALIASGLLAPAPAPANPRDAWPAWTDHPVEEIHEAAYDRYAIGDPCDVTAPFAAGYRSGVGR